MVNGILISIIIPLFTGLIGVIVGGMITYYISLNILEREQNIRKVNVAKAFLSEIKSLERWIKPGIEENFIIEGDNKIRFNFEVVPKLMSVQVRLGPHEFSRS